jgi:hypothetical protein
MKNQIVLSQLLLGSAGLAFGQTPPPVSPPPGAGAQPQAIQTPAYTPVRWNENYSYLSDESKRTDFFDPIKHIPLGPDDWYLSLGGQARYRYEYFDEFNFGDPFVQDDDGYHLTRFMGHADTSEITSAASSSLSARTSPTATAARASSPPAPRTASTATTLMSTRRSWTSSSRSMKRRSSSAAAGRTCFTARSA